jgi:hypothetical protein
LFVVHAGGKGIVHFKNKKMKEELVSFETAKIAKEAGFNITCSNKYRKGGTLSDGKGFLQNLDICEAPTQSLLRKWLRKKHRIHIEIPHYSDAPTGSEYESDLGSFGANVNEPRTSHECDIFVSSINHETYEQALEEALLEALKYVP